MGADLIVTTLWYHLGDVEKFSRTRHDGTVMEWEGRPPKIDWDLLDKRVIEAVTTWTEEQVTTAANDYRSDVLDQLTDWDQEPLDSRRNVLVTSVQDDIAELKSIFTGEDKDGQHVIHRDVDERRFESGIAYIVTGGMSWGDGPTDAYDLITRLLDEDGSPGVAEAMEQAGFIIDPYSRVGLIR